MSAPSKGSAYSTADDGEDDDEEELEFLDSSATTSSSSKVEGGDSNRGISSSSSSSSSSSQGIGVNAAGSGESAGGLGGANDGVVSLFRNSNHPVAMLFHLLFRTAAIVVYVFSGWFTDNFVLVFVICVLLQAFDFWTVKNVTGRLMVGLRWWNDIDEDGANQWRFESIDNPAEVGAVDKRVFWYGHYFAVIVWAIFCFMALIKLSFDWLLICVVAFVLSSSNLYGYWMCSRDSQERLKNSVQSVVSQGALSALSGSFSNSFSNMFSGRGSGSGSGNGNTNNSASGGQQGLPSV